MQIVSWLVVMQGILLGMLIIAVTGGTSVGDITPASVVVGFVVGLIAILASIVATRNQRTAARIDLWGALMIPLFVVAFSWEFGRIAWAIAVFSGALVIPGLFWLLAARRKWPPVLPGSLFLRYPGRSAFLGAVVLCVLAVGALVWSLALPWWPPIGDCVGRSLLDQRGVPRGTDFTAKIILVGPRTFRGKSLWSIAHVEERFSGRPEAAGFVVLRGFFEPRDNSRRYFVEGYRSRTVFAHFLPTVTPIDCGHTAPSDSAAVALRVLHDGPPMSGGRLIGRVYKGWDMDSRIPVPGARISIEGPSGSTVSTTDAQGIYDATDLPPGEYTLRLSTGVGASTVGPRIYMKLRGREVGGPDFYIR